MAHAEENRRLVISADVVQTLRQAAQLAYPEEGCGLLLGQWQTNGAVAIRQAVLVPNRAEPAERPHRYTIEPRLLLEWERIAQRSGLSIVGFFHSHPDAEPRPSATDARLAWPSYIYVIVSAAGRRAEPGNVPLITGMAAWTFVEASSSFFEVPVTVEVAADEIEYFI